MSRFFVFYTINPSLKEPPSWSYGRLPAKWWWVGAGMTTPFGPRKTSKRVLYEREKQFNGPIESRKKMATYLDAYFAKLKERGIVLRYKIRNAFKP